MILNEKELIMQLTDYAQAIVKSAKSIAVARSYDFVEPEHFMLSLMLDENDLPKIFLSKIDLGKKEISKALDIYIVKKPFKKRAIGFNIPFSSACSDLFNLAQEEALRLKDDEVNIEHFFLALFKAKSSILDCLWENFKLKKEDLYQKMKTVVENIITVDILDKKEKEEEKKMNKEKAIEDSKSALEKYTIDLTAIAKEHKLDPVIGRDDEIRRIIQILNRRSKNNPIVIGEPGVGKTAVIEGLAQRIVNGDVPEGLKNDRILSLDLGALLAGASFSGDFEKRFKAVLKEVEEQSADLMLFIDEIHMIVGMGGASGSMDAGNLLKPLLARGSVRIIGATTLNEYRLYIEKDKALERRFQPIMVEEPSIESTISILRGLKGKYEVFHGVKILDSAIQQAVKLSHRYICDRYLPDKAIDLIDEAASALRIEIDTMPEEIDCFMREKIQCEIEREILKKEPTKESEAKIAGINKKTEALGLQIENFKAQWTQEKKVIETYAIVKKNLEIIKCQIAREEKNPDVTSPAELKYCQMIEMEKKLKDMQENQSDKQLIKEEIDGDDISRIIEKRTGIPVSRMMEDETEKLVMMESYMHKRVVGQSEAIIKIANAIRLGRSGMNDPNRPIGTFLFLGPTGVGKTELGKTLAEFLFSDEDSLIRIDMSEFMEKHNVSRLVGATAGYVGYEDGGQLTEAVRRKPYSVVLFDEVEKAHSDIFNIMLQMFDEGRLTDGKGKLIDFKNTIIIMTSNLGSDILLNENMGQPEKLNELNQLLKTKFKPEFLNRIDETVMFTPLGIEELSKIVDFQMVKLKKRLIEQNIEFEVTESAKKHLAKEGFEPLYGARPLKRIIRQLIEIPVSLKILKNEFTKGDKILIDHNGSELKIQKNTNAVPVS